MDDIDRTDDYEIEIEKEIRELKEQVKALLEEIKTRMLLLEILRKPSQLKKEVRHDR